MNQTLHRLTIGTVFCRILLCVALATPASAKQPAHSDNIYNWPGLDVGMWMPNIRSGFSLVPTAGQANSAAKALTPAALAEVEARRAKIGVSATCHPFGPIGMAIFPIKFYFTPGQILIMSDTDQLAVRHVHMDGRTHEGVDPTYYGHSIGHWEGKTLVIDTVQLLPTVQSVHGALATPSTHVVERYTLTAPDKMHLSMSVEDPAVLNMPYQLERDYVHQPGWDIQDVSCEEGNNRDAPDANGQESLNLTPPQ